MFWKIRIRNLVSTLATLPETGFGHTNFSRRSWLKAHKKILVAEMTKLASDIFFLEKYKPNVNPKTHIPPKRLQNWELGPILGQKGDPDLTKLSPTLPTPKSPKKKTRNKSPKRLSTKCYKFPICTGQTDQVDPSKSQGGLLGGQSPGRKLSF